MNLGSYDGCTVTRTRAARPVIAEVGQGLVNVMSDLNCCVLISYNAGTLYSTRSQVTACLVRVLFRFAPKGTPLQRHAFRHNKQADRQCFFD